MADNHALLCPSCGQLDAVRKVSAIVTEGISSHSVQLSGGITGSVSGQSTSITGLSSRLAPPPKPVNRSSRFLLGAALSAGITMFLLFFLSTDPLAQKDSISMFFTGAFGVFAAAGFIGWLVFRPRYRQELARWEQAVAKWRELYYCARCDGVFAAQERNFIPTAQMRHYLHT